MKFPLKHSKLKHKRRKVVINSSEDEESSLDHEDSPKQWRMIKEIDEDENVNLVQSSKQGTKKARGTLKRKTSKAREGKDKRQKKQDDLEKLTLINYVEVIFDFEKVINVIPLAVKSPVVNWKSYCKGYVRYYEIHWADGSYKTYIFFSEMLNDFDREDQIVLYRLFNENDDAVWKNHHNQELIEWKLYDSCGVHSLMLGEDLNARHLLEMAQKFAIRGILVNGDWIEEPSKVKDEFLNHFSNCFSKPDGPCMTPAASLFKQISFDQNVDLESNMNYEEIIRAVWDCGTNKSSGPDGFTFEFFRRYWNIINQDVINVVHELFASVKDFRPISLIGSFYKIVAKIMANRLSLVTADLISDVQFAFVLNQQILDGPFILSELIQWCKYHKAKAMVFKADFEKDFDSVRWDYLDGILSNFGFGAKWRGWIQGLKINIIKSTIMGIGTTEEEVNSAAKIIGCSTFSSPFKYLGVKWKAKSLSIGGRFTLIKSVLTSLPLYFMSIYKAPMGVLHKLKSIRRNFFNGVDNNERKINMIRSDRISLWSRLIRAIHGDDIINTGCFSRSSPWIYITREVRSLYLKGINLLDHVKKKVGNRSTTLFWKDPWFAESPLIKLFPRLFALESNKNATVAEKFHNISLSHSFRRRPRGAIGSPTRWVKTVPIKINIFAWKVCLDKLPTRLNLSLRGIDIPSISCPICSLASESCAHLLFSCSMAKALYSKAARWCEMEIYVFYSYEDWINWFISLRFSKAFKDMLEDIFCDVVGDLEVPQPNSFWYNSTPEGVYFR
nr:RNA-directed DNA polymerase, eukaryota [Tanacetum cinerariifolium]